MGSTFWGVSGRVRTAAGHGVDRPCDAANTIEAMRLGAFDHLAKPIGREELSRVLVGMLPPERNRRVPTPTGAGRIDRVE